MSKSFSGKCSLRYIAITVESITTTSPVHITALLFFSDLETQRPNPSVKVPLHQCIQDALIIRSRKLGHIAPEEHFSRFAQNQPTIHLHTDQHRYRSVREQVREHRSSHIPAPHCG